MVPAQAIPELENFSNADSKKIAKGRGVIFKKLAQLQLPSNDGKAMGFNVIDEASPRRSNGTDQAG